MGISYVVMFGFGKTRDGNGQFEHGGIFVFVFIPFYSRVPVMIWAWVVLLYIFIYRTY